MGKRTSSKALAEVSEHELADFDLMDRPTQESLVEGLQAIADNPRVSKRDRTISEQRARAFRSRITGRNK